MKKTLTLLLALVFTGLVAHAQFDIKIHAGSNTLSVKQNPSFGNLNPKAGLQFGGSVAIGKKFYVEPGVFIWAINQEISFDSIQGSSYGHRVGGWRFPLHIGYSIIKQSNDFLNLRVFTGVVYNYLNTINSDLPNVTLDNYNKSQWGINAGLGFSIWFVFIDLGYEWGLTEIFRDHNAKYQQFWGNLGIRIRI